MNQGICPACGTLNSFSSSDCFSCLRSLPWAAYLAYLNGTVSLKEQGVSEKKMHRFVSKLIYDEIDAAQWKAEVKPVAFRLHVWQTANVRDRHLTSLSWAQMHSNILYIFASINEFEARFTADPQGIRKLRTNRDGNNPFEAESYARLGLGRCTSQNIELWMSAEEGHTKARRIKSTPTCGKSCTAEARRGWVPIVDFTPFGRNKPWNDCWCQLETK